MSFSINHLGNSGHLGNQMFQYAFVKSLAKRYNTKFCIPPKEVFGKLYYQRLFSNIDEAFDLNCHRETSAYTDVIEKVFHYDDELVNSLSSGDYNLVGFFQSEKYFKNISDELRNNDFKFNHDIIEDCEPIVSEYKDSISLHIRRNDYLTNSNHPVQPIEYYISALSKMPKELPVLIFSDDPEWCKEQETFDDDRFLISETGNPYFDLYIMTKCKYHIIANSSYSWWGAWLSNSNDVIAPSKWFSEDNSDKDTKDLYVEGWRVI